MNKTSFLSVKNWTMLSCYASFTMLLPLPLMGSIVLDVFLIVMAMISILKFIAVR